MKSIIFIAPPAAGKGTQSDLLQKEYGYSHISTGDMLREAIAEGSELGLSVKNIIDKGGLVSDDIMISLISEKLNSLTGKPFILDGFPRTLNQAVALDDMLSSKNLDDYVAIFLNISEEEAMKRIVGRLTCSCGKSYNIFEETLKPKVENICDECGATLIKRADDNEESFKVRYNTFMENNQPILDFYKNKDKLLEIKVDRDYQGVFEEISKGINNG